MAQTRSALAFALCLALAAPFAGLVAVVRAQAQDEAPKNAALEKLRRELVRLGREQQASEHTAAEWRSRLIELNARQTDLDKRMGANRDSLVKLLGALEMFRRNPPPALLVNPRSASDSVRAAILMRAVLPDLELRRRAYLAEEEDLNRIRRAASVASAGLFSAESAEADRRARIDRLMAAKSDLETTLDPSAADRLQQVRQAAEKSSDVGDLLGRLGGGASAGGETASVPGLLHLEPPVTGDLVRRFGDLNARPGEDRRRSKGVAWRAAAGATVLSPADATVDYAGPVKGVGLVLILRLSGDYRAVITGLDRITALTGRQLAAGEPVGRMPEGKGADLVLELRRKAQPVDPAQWMVKN